MARIKRRTRSGSCQVTLSGDSLYDITLPVVAYLYFPELQALSSKEVVEPALKGLPEEIDPIAVEIVALRKGSQKRGGREAELSIVPREAEERYPEEWDGGWVCLPKKLLAETGHFYFFQLKGCTVHRSENTDRVAVIENLIDNGAHTILVTRTNDQKEVLIPFVDHYVTVDLMQNRIIVPDFDFFVVS